MSTNTSHSQNSIGESVPDGYEYHEHAGQPRWTHQETGLQAGLIRNRKPTAHELTHSAAVQSSDSTWIFEVRPGGRGNRADIYDELAGDRDAALQHAVEWLGNHPDGEF